MTAAETSGREGKSRTRSVVDSAVGAAHKVALAGVGAAGEAADAGVKVFDRLVERGGKAESRGLESVAEWRDKAEATVQGVRSKAGHATSRARAGIDQGLARRLEAIGVPGKADLQAVVERLTAIEERLGRLEAVASAARTDEKAADQES